MRVVAIVAAYNEADIIEHVVKHLIAEGVEVYFIDNGSTDGTVDVVEQFVGNGVIAIEHFASPPAPDGAEPAFQWEQILLRKEELARTLDADWFIHHDADEFRESPWRDRSLAAAIRDVDRAGYNAIDFAVLNFWPTHDRFRPGDDVRQSFTHYEPGSTFDRVQVKCWKRPSGALHLASTGGHEARFADRKVFPLRFILRHYPIRGQEHGARKVFSERRPRFDPAERARGWHVQYDDITPEHQFLRDPTSMTLFDPDAVRLHLMVENRVVEVLREQNPGSEAALRREAAVDWLSTQRDELLAGQENRDKAIAWLQQQVTDHQAQVEAHRIERDMIQQSLEHEIVVLRQEIAARIGELAGVSAALDQANHDATNLRAALDRADEHVASLMSELEAMRSSLSWRLTSPLRWLGSRRGNNDQAESA